MHPGGRSLPNGAKNPSRPRLTSNMLPPPVQPLSLPKLGSRLWQVAALLTLLFWSAPALAFTHIVQAGETLAGIAEKFYGKIQHEKLLVVANGLDVQGGVGITAGMRLEVPALTYLRIGRGHTWKELSTRLLGGEHRAHALAEANNSKAWLFPPEDSEIVVPYNLRFVCTGKETVVGLAYLFLGDRRKAWMLDQYNDRKGRRLVRGETLLLPIVDISLTEAGQEAASQASLLVSKQAGGADRAAQAKVRTELPLLTADVRAGRYVDAVRRGLIFLSLGALTREQRGQIQRALLESYAALGATGLAAEACGLWRKEDPRAKLDPVQLSPKLIDACERGATESETQNEAEPGPSLAPSPKPPATASGKSP